MYCFNLMRIFFNNENITINHGIKKNANIVEGVYHIPSLEGRFSEYPMTTIYNA